MSGESNHTGKKVIISITGFLETDQRVHKVAVSLNGSGFKPLLIGRSINSYTQIQKRIYLTRTIKTLFLKGLLFYAEYNFRLFLILFFSRASIYLSNDLDTLPANYLAYRFKRLLGFNIKLVYDSHEIFTEVPELMNRKWTKNIWTKIEKYILPKLRNTYTVCEPIANYYKQKYGVNMLVIKNLPICKSINPNDNRLKINLPDNKKIILYQGALNIGRGIEHIIPLMKQLNNAIFIIIGRGDIENELEKLVISEKLGDSVIFTGPMSMEQLNTFTPKADLGVVLQEDSGLSYHHVLPNRLFDFINAGVPVLASALPEIKAIVESENIGITVKGFEPEILLKNLKILLNDTQRIQEFRKNLASCKTKFCWENQEHILNHLFMNLMD